MQQDPRRDRIEHDGEPGRRWRFRAALPEDERWIRALAAEAMRADHDRLGTGELAARLLAERYADTAHRIMQIDGTDVGVIGVRREPDAQWIEHFYLGARARGLGLGGSVLDAVIAELREDPRPIRLAVNRGSAARRLYERHGFRYAEDAANGIEEVLTLSTVDPAAGRSVFG